ncbi:MAG: chromosomal replication initiator protein DnaA [Candidatus Omnitrophota bacterium]
MKTVNKASFAKIWQDCLPELKKSLGETTFDTWIASLTINEELSQQAQKLILEAPDPFFKNWVFKNYLPIIQKVLESKLSTGQSALGVEIKMASGDRSSAPPAAPTATPTTAQEIKIKDFQNQWFGKQNESFVLNPRLTFEHFVVGPCNRFAHAAALAIVELPARAYNPFFIYGGVGLGKTHLMQAICHHIRSTNKATKICYISSEKFTNELISSIQHRTTPAFRQKYRNMDVLVIDDIHFIAGKEATQEEFFHTFNTLYDAHKQIIISSDRSPREILKLEERLVSRFNWGLITDIQPPDLETRIAILKKKIEKEPIDIPDQVIFFIAQLITRNIRELEGGLVRVIARSLLEERKIDLESTKEILKDFISQTQMPITLDKIQTCVANGFDVPLVELKAKRRNKNIVLPRQVAMYLCRQLTEASLPEIARFFGGKDHTTILYAYKKIKSCLNQDGNLKQKVIRIVQDIKR